MPAPLLNEAVDGFTPLQPCPDCAREWTTATLLLASVGAIVAEVREEAGITQKEMAQRLNVHQSQISRLEGRGGKAESKDFERYLLVLGSDRALKPAEILKVEWRQLSYPSLKHPNLEVLVEIEEALQRLQDFRESQSMPQVLAGQADLLFRRLVAVRSTARSRRVDPAAVKLAVAKVAFIVAHHQAPHHSRRAKL